MDYEKEKEKQEAIWRQFQEKRKKLGGRGVVFEEAFFKEILGVTSFFKALQELDTQEKHRKAIKNSKKSSISHTN